MRALCLFITLQLWKCSDLHFILSHVPQDQHVADGALRCFASLADRFTRRAQDPAPLAQHCLVTHLLARLAGGSQHEAEFCF